MGSSLTGASIREEVVLPSGTSSTTIGSYSTVELFSGGAHVAHTVKITYRYGRRMDRSLEGSPGVVWDDDGLHFLIAVSDGGLGLFTALPRLE